MDSKGILAAGPDIYFHDRIDRSFVSIHQTLLKVDILDFGIVNKFKLYRAPYS